MELNFPFTRLFFLSIFASCRALDSRVVGPPQPITAVAGDDVVLPCHLDPPANAVTIAVEWIRPDLKPQYVHLHRNSRDLFEEKNPLYSHRTVLYLGEMHTGNISLKLYRVRLSDEGKYTCYIPSAKSHKSAVIHLLVDPPEPEISIIGTNVSGVVLQCESKGWSPKPELEWREKDGAKPLHAVTETVQDPSGLYTLTSQVIVQKTASNKFICRVQQRHINKSTKAEIHVPEEFFHSSLVAILGAFFGVALLALVVIGVLLCAYALKKRKEKERAATQGRESSEGEPMTQPNQSLNEEKGGDTDMIALTQENQLRAPPNQSLNEDNDHVDASTPLCENVASPAPQPEVPCDQFNMQIVPVSQVCVTKPQFACKYDIRTTIRDETYTFFDSTPDGLYKQVSRFRTFPDKPTDIFSSSGVTPTPSQSLHSLSAESVGQGVNTGTTS